VVRAIKHLSGVDFPAVVAERRAGDPPMLIAENAKIKKILGWQPENDELELIVSSALHWEKVCAQRAEINGNSLARH
jgi:UDP-glucose 4-epimerase